MCVIKGNEIKLRYSLFRGSFVIDLLHEQKEQNKMSFFFFFSYFSRYGYCSDFLQADVF